MRTFWLILGLAGSVSLAVGQELGAPDPNTYDSFLRQVVQQKTVKDVLTFLTEDQLAALNSIAADLGETSPPLIDAVKALVFENRLAALASETPSREVSRQLEEIIRQRTQVVVDHVERLRAALGEPGFRMLESFIGSRKDSGFFPQVTTGISRPVARTKAVAR